MSANLSLILNLLLLAGIVVAITRLVRQHRPTSQAPSENHDTQTKPNERTGLDDIIAVRRVQAEEVSPKIPSIEPTHAPATPPQKARAKPAMAAQKETPLEQLSNPAMIFIAAKKNRQFAGYELLQAILSTGLRYGEGNLFHRHQGDNGQGTLMCSLAAATESGQFNLQRMGAFTCRGLCLFMEASHNSSIDQERFTVMHDVAEQLAEELDAQMLDEKHKPFSESSLEQYEKRLGCELALAVEVD